jgi:hypothetical protein
MFSHCYFISSDFLGFRSKFVMSLNIKLATLALQNELQNAAKQLQLGPLRNKENISSTKQLKLVPNRKKSKDPVTIIVHPSVSELKWDAKQVSVSSTLDFVCPSSKCTSLTFSSAATLFQHVQQLHPYLVTSNNAKTVCY